MPYVSVLTEHGTNVVIMLFLQITYQALMSINISEYLKKRMKNSAIIINKSDIYIYIYIVIKHAIC